MNFEKEASRPTRAPSPTLELDAVVDLGLYLRERLSLNGRAAPFIRDPGLASDEWTGEFTRWHRCVLAYGVVGSWNR